MARFQPGSSRIRKPFVRAVLFTLFLLSTLLLAACGGTTQEEGSKPTTLSILASPNGNFTSTNFNPYIEPAAGGLYGAQGMVYETLIYQNRYNGEISPMLASDYEFPADAKSITFTIRENVKWSDGHPFSAEDVLYSLNLLKQVPAYDQDGLWTTVIQDVSSPDPKTVKVTFKQAISIAPWFFAQTFIVPKHDWEKVSDITKHTNSKPVGTGPYTLDTFSPETYVLKRNTQYWQADKPKIERLRYVATKDNTAASLLISQGKIDWAGVGWDPKQDANFIGKNPDKHHHWFPSNNTVMLYLNLTKFPFNILEVRQAISYAIDRPELQERAAPYATPAHPTALLPSHSDFIPDEYKDAAFKRDLDKANELMQKAGFTKGSDGIYAKDGQKVSFKMAVPNGWGDWQNSLSLISNHLKEAGMDAKVEATATPEIYQESLNSGTFEAAISWTNKGPSPFFFLNDWLASTKTWDQASGKKVSGTTNWQHWVDPETDRLLDQYMNSADPAVQKEAIGGLTKIIVEKLPAIPLNYNVGWFEYTTHNADGWPDKDDPYTYGSPFDSPDNAQIVLNLTPVK